jgi:hypothetical protein
MRRAVAVLSSALAAVTMLAACGQDEPAPSSGDEDTIRITIEDGSVSPRGDRFEMTAGEPVEIEIKADEPGELHVHSTPEQELPYGSGTTTTQLTIDQPGVVDVESHDPDVVVVQLEVR